MLLDIIAVILGILYTVRKLDVRKREPEDYPHVPRADFERWRDLEGGAYSIASVACFLKILLDYAFVFYAGRTALDLRVVRVVGASLFLAWVLTLVYAFRRGHLGRKLRERLGIDLSPKPAPESPESPD